MRPNLSHVRRTAYGTKLIASHPEGSARRRLLRDYWKLKARQLGGERGPGRASVLGWDIEFFDIDTFAFVFEEIFVERSYDVDLPPQPFIIDCGANIGLASLFFADRHPGARIVAYEPGSATFCVLEDNLRRAGVSAELHREAVSDADGEVELYHDTSPGSVGSSTLADAHASIGSERVPARRLSHRVTERVDLLKLDVEGAEHLVLAELAEAGSLASVDRIVFDYNHHLAGADELGRTLSLLEGAGFGYQLSGPFSLPFRAGVPQDLIIFAYRR